MRAALVLCLCAMFRVGGTSCAATAASQPRHTAVAAAACSERRCPPPGSHGTPSPVTCARLLPHVCSDARCRPRGGWRRSRIASVCCAKLRSERSRRRAVVRRPPLRAGCDIGMRYDIMPPQNSTRPWLALLDLAAADQGAPSAPYSKSPANRGQCSHEARRWSCDAPLTPAATASGSNARAAESRRHLPGRGPSHDGMLKRGGGAWSAHSTWADEA